MKHRDSYFIRSKINASLTNSNQLRKIMNFLLLFFNLYPKQTNWRIFAKNISSECIYVKARNGILNMKSEKEIGRYCQKEQNKNTKPIIYKTNLDFVCWDETKHKSNLFVTFFNFDIMFNPKIEYSKIMKKFSINYNYFQKNLKIIFIFFTLNVIVVLKRDFQKNNCSSAKLNILKFSFLFLLLGNSLKSP